MAIMRVSAITILALFGAWSVPWERAFSEAVARPPLSPQRRPERQIETMIHRLFTNAIR